MNTRKRAFEKGLRQIARKKLARPSRRLGTIKKNQIIQGDSIALLNEGEGGWADLVFADPPFNIGYLYHGYNDKRNTDDYLKFSEDWMRAVHRALKPSGSFYLAIGDEYAADLAVIARRKIGFHMRNW